MELLGCIQIYSIQILLVKIVTRFIWKKLFCNLIEQKIIMRQTNRLKCQEDHSYSTFKYGQNTIKSKIQLWCGKIKMQI